MGGISLMTSIQCPTDSSRGCTERLVAPRSCPLGEPSMQVSVRCMPVSVTWPNCGLCCEEKWLLLRKRRPKNCLCWFHLFPFHQITPETFSDVYKPIGVHPEHWLYFKKEHCVGFSFFFLFLLESPHLLVLLADSPFSCLRCLCLKWFWDYSAGWWPWAHHSSYRRKPNAGGCLGLLAMVCC